MKQRKIILKGKVSVWVMYDGNIVLADVYTDDKGNKVYSLVSDSEVVLQESIIEKIPLNERTLRNFRLQQGYAANSDKDIDEPNSSIESLVEDFIEIEGISRSICDIIKDNNFTSLDELQEYIFEFDEYVIPVLYL